MRACHTRSTIGHEADTPAAQGSPGVSALGALIDPALLLHPPFSRPCILLGSRAEGARLCRVGRARSDQDELHGSTPGQNEGSRPLYAKPRHRGTEPANPSCPRWFELSIRISLAALVSSRVKLLLKQPNRSRNHPFLAKRTAEHTLDQYDRPRQ